MEAPGRDGRHGARRHGTSSTTTSGTVSSGYTSTSSRLSWISMEAARHFRELEMEDLEVVGPPKETASEKKMKQIKILAKEFFGAPSSAKCSAEGGDPSVLKRWLRELGVEWVLHVADGTLAPAEGLEHALDASSWSLALSEIVDTFHLASGLLPVHGSTEEQNMAEQLQLAGFTQQALLKMLTFVDSMVAPNLSCGIDWSLVLIGAPYKKFHTLLRLCEALRNALTEIQLPLHSSYSAEVATILGEIVDTLSAKEGKVREAIWNALEEIRTRILESPEDGQGSSHTQTPQGSSDVDETTKSVVKYAIFLEDYDSIMEPIVSEAASLGKYIPRVGEPPLISLRVEMVSCLEEKLANKSEAFSDQGLRFLFLLNNSFFIMDELRYALFFHESCKADLAGKVEGYMERFIQVSWAPVLSCLINPTPSCLGKNYSPMSKFESEFQKMYTTQKLLKVRYPDLRNRLRRAIIDKIIPAYTRYLADDYGNAPQKFSPSNLEEMLQELFEG